ncbi:GDP-L-fucose synthase [uncultured archaeon]|nr:GDP-L-fucose synthase [uncultured archaeon]
MILVTGATGFIGRNLVPMLLAKKEKIRVVTRNMAGLQMIPGIAETLEGDLRDENFSDMAVKGCSAVIHLAAAIKSKSPEEGFEANVKITGNLVNSAKKYGTKKIVFLSSDAVMQKHRDTYGITKEAAEGIVRKFRNHVILRATIVYGKGDSKNLRAISGHIKKWPIVVMPCSGKGKIQPISVEDLSAYIIASLGPGVSGTYIAAGGDKMTIREVVEKLMTAMGQKKPVVFLPSAVFAAAGRVISVFLPGAISSAQIFNLEEDRTYNTGETVKKLKHMPEKFDKRIYSIIE